MGRLATEDCIEAVEGIRRTLAEAAGEGYPTAYEIALLTRRTRRAAREGRDVAKRV